LSKHVFGELARGGLSSPVGRRLAVSILSAAFVVGVLPALPPAAPVHLSTTPVAGSSWLDRLNQWRISTGLPTLTENTTWSAGDAAHAFYMVKTGLVTHYEDPSNPYYTTAGDLAAQHSNIQVSSTTSTTDQSAIDWWMGAPFHAMAMMDPRLTTTGFGSYRDSTTSPWQEGGALNTIDGNSFSGGSYPVYFPGNGTTEPLTNYSGNEFPDPLQACPGYSMPTGLPVFIEVGGNVNTTVGPVHSFTGNGVALNHCVIDSSNSAVSSYLYTRGGVILVPQQPLQNGVKYVVALTVNGTPYTWSFTVGNFTACTSVTASAVPSSQSMPGTAVTFTGSAVGCPTPRYEFWVLPPGSSTWTVAQAYSANATFVWNTTGLAIGTYRFSVWARDVTSTGAISTSLGSFDTFVGINHDLGTPPCTSVTASAAPPSPSAPGTAVTFTGVAAGCANPLYQFWILPPGSSTWTIARAYSSSATFSWTTTGMAAGLYHFGVWVRDAGSAGVSCNSLGCNDAFVAINYTLTSTVCASVTASAAPPSPSLPGTPVTFTGVASGCSSPLYEYWVLIPGSTTWTVAQAYSSNAQFAWNNTGRPGGLYRFSVWVRDSSSSGISCNSLGCNDNFVGINYTLSSACASATASDAPPTASTSGTAVVLTGVASGCTNPLYEFWILAPGSSMWMVAQPYSTAATFNWNTTGLPAGFYRFSVWVRDAASSGISCNSLGCNDAFVAINHTLTSTPCTSVTASASPPSPSAHGTAISFTGVASGCPNPLYQFWILAPGSSTWTIVQGYSTSATFNWSTTGLPAGTYRFSVWVRDASSSGISCNSLGCNDNFAGINYMLT
jgi:cysteine-rich secretory family protein